LREYAPASISAIAENEGVCLSSSPFPGTKAGLFGRATLFQESWGRNTALPARPSRPSRVLRARDVFQDMRRWHDRLFENGGGCFREFAARQAAFNSQLTDFIAAADDSEDQVGHSRFVAAYSVLLARAMGIEDADFLIDLERGAMLHDIGKIGLPQPILRKQGPLTAIEKEIVKGHPLLGYKLIAGLDFLGRASNIVLFHHELYDGSGYPYGLSGEDIPLEARIFSLADTADAITSDRSYHERGSFVDVFREVERGSGGQFDPAIVEVFLSIPRSRWEMTGESTLKSLRLAATH